jgi:hypothetical protein
MRTFKYIFVCGTSFTAGGGFEDGNITTRTILEKYIDEPIPEKMEDCAWPAYLKKLIDKDIKIYNLALPGAGTEYLIRTTNEWIDKNPDKVKDTLFLLENSGYGRIELWDVELDKYIVCNWDYAIRKEKFCASAHSGKYWEDSHEAAQKIINKEPLIESWLDTFGEPMKMVEDLNNRFFNFLCKLKHKEIEFKIFGEPMCDPKLNEDSLILENRLTLNTGDKEINHIHDFLIINNLQIKQLTNGESDDFHATLEGNKVLAQVYYNQIKKHYDL